MANWNGQLPSNVSNFTTLFNMVTSIFTYADNIKGTFSRLADEFRIEGSLYGSVKEYIDNEILTSYAWDGSDFDVLQPAYPKQPKTQVIELKHFRQIALTLGKYIEKNAFLDEGSFGQFISAIQAQIQNTKRIYESSLVNAYVGTAESAVGKQTQSITFPKNTDPEKAARIKARMTAEKAANLLYSDLQDVSTEYTDNAFHKSFTLDDFILVWNNDVYQNILKTDLPAAYFNQEGTLIPKFGDHVLPSRFFGTINTTAGTTTANNSTVRSLVEKDYVKGGNKVHVYIGELLPSEQSYDANETYTVDPTIMFKIIHKRAIPYISTFSVGTNFMNAKSLKNTFYETWGYEIDRLKGYPCVTVRGVQAN